jgi:predicted metalloendopeptidase
VRAQDDFFRRVNGRWLKTTEFPADKAYLGSFEALHDKIQVELRGLVEKAVETRANADERASPTSTRASSTRPRSSAPASRRSPASWRSSTRCSRRASCPR